MRRSAATLCGSSAASGSWRRSWGRGSVRGSEARCELVTVVGDAGVGKSRLVAEALAAVEARVVRGRCLPYGEGITYWPVVEVVKQLAVLPSDPVAAAAIRSLLGESEVGTSGDEIAWAFRKLLEEQAPLVVVFDDIQWGDETFLDLVESTALLSAGAPLLLLCMARPELVERRPAWPATLRLEPLPPEQADALIGDAVSGELRERIAHAAGGNPLFISEMLAMAAEDADVEVPPTLKALLAARLDQLDEAERRVLERGSVEGEIFHRGAVQALAPEETQVTTRLAALVRHQLVRPDRAQLAGDDGYRFRHLLIRDAAYDALPKAVRADLHARFADWLDEHGDALVERDEIVGYHLEQAARYRAELGQPDPTWPTAPPPGSRPRADRAATAGTAGPERRCSPARPSSSDRTGSTSRSSSSPHGRQRPSICVRPQRRPKPSPNVPRPRATIPGRCSRVRWPSSCARPEASPTRSTRGRAAAVPRFPSRRSGVIRAGSRCSGSCSPSRELPHAERRRRRSRCRRSLPAAWPATLLTIGPGVGADHRPAAGRRGDADDRRGRRPGGPRDPGPPAGGAARDARPLRRGVAARRGAVEPPARGDRQHLGTPTGTSR